MLLRKADGLAPTCKAYRKLHNLTQKQLAEMVGSGKSVIWRIENGLEFEVAKTLVEKVNEIISINRNMPPTFIK